MIQLTPPITKSLLSNKRLASPQASFGVRLFRIPKDVCGEANKRPASTFSFVLDAPVFFMLAKVSLFKALSVYDFLSHAREKPLLAGCEQSSKRSSFFA